MKKIHFAIVISIIATACVREFPFRQGEVDLSAIVVNGYITNEYKRHTIEISRLSSYEDTVRNMLAGAFVAVSSGDSTYYYKEVANGVYESSDKFVGIVGNVYFLHIELGDSVVLSAKSTMMPVTPPDEITFHEHDNGMRAISYIAPSFVPDNPAKYVIQLQWSENGEDTRIANLYYYSLTTVDISQLFAPKVQETLFPKGTQLIERKYSIDKDYEIYLRSLLAETLWSGGYFDEAHGNLQTNIQCDLGHAKTAGYFSANTVYIDTLIVE